MAATIQTQDQQQTAKILPFPTRCQEVKQTDRNKRLPTLSSADIESFFDHAQTRDTTMAKAA